jgi:hypothetical protein
MLYYLLDYSLCFPQACFAFLDGERYMKDSIWEFFQVRLNLTPMIQSGPSHGETFRKKGDLLTCFYQG